MGPRIDDVETLDQLPADLRGVLVEVNGFVAFGGGLHVRGACLEPRWHALRAVAARERLGFLARLARRISG